MLLKYDITLDMEVLEKAESESETTSDSHNQTQSQRSLDKEGEKFCHSTILGRESLTSAQVFLHRCTKLECCDNKVHCPFCDIRQYKPSQPARVRDHLHLTHFQHAVYYDGLMVVKCFHMCRGQETKGGHYHCPACSTTLLKRNAFIKHLHSHALREGLGQDAVQAPDAKRPAIVYFKGHSIALCRVKCPNTLEPHFHCPLCQQSQEQLSSLTAHLWRCQKRAVMVTSRTDNFGYTINVAKLFSPEAVQFVPHLKEVAEFKWHLSIVRNLSDLPLKKCDLPDCCNRRYHCPLCTTSKLKPNHLCHMKQHFVSHWRSGVRFKDYTVLVCYLPCELTNGVDKIRFHYHCPLCSGTRRRREGFARHLLICNPSQSRDPSSEADELDNDDEEDLINFPSITENSWVPLSEADAWSPHHVLLSMSQAPFSRKKSADQAELQAAESLADMDRILMESLNKAMEPGTLPPDAAKGKQSEIMSSIASGTFQETQSMTDNCSRSSINQPVKEGIGKTAKQIESSISDVMINQSNPEAATLKHSRESEPTSHVAIIGSCSADSAEKFRGPQISVSCADQAKTEVFGETVVKQCVEDDLPLTVTKEEHEGPTDSMISDNIQIFEQVTTQLSDIIVTELRKQGNLEQCLQAISQICKVTWQHGEAAVNMTCDFEELSYIQKCLKQILTEGLQSFLDLPPARLSKLSISSRPQANHLKDGHASACKRGRPKGRKNMPVNISPGYYCGRTRGKYIDFVRLDSGNTYEDSVEDAKSPLVCSSAIVDSSVAIKIKKARGRPKKISLSKPDSNALQQIAMLEDETGLGKVNLQKEQSSDENERLTKHSKNEEKKTEISMEKDLAPRDPSKPVRKRRSNDKTQSPLMIVSHTNIKERKQTLPIQEILHESKSSRLTDITIAKDTSGDKYGCKSQVQMQQKDTSNPTIFGHSQQMYQGRLGATDFAIIPSIFFKQGSDRMVDEEGDVFDLLPSQKDAVENTGTLKVNGTDTVRTSEAQRDSKWCRDEETELQHEKDDQSTQTDTKALFRCPICKATYSTYSLLSCHFSTQHPNRAPLMCNVCEVVCPTQGALSLHVERRHGPKPEKSSATLPEACTCLTCGKVCLSVGSLRWHHTLVHKVKTIHNRRNHRLKCVLCKYTAVDNWDMRHHREQHHTQPATCPVCRKTLSTEAALKVHFSAKHSGDTFTCEICKKTFAHIRYLRSHLQRHMGEKRHVCSICGWRFHQTNTLKSHMDTHKPRTQRKYSFQCPHCPAAYNSRANWRDHLNKHTGARPHVCSKCGKGFAFRSMLTTHTAFVHSTNRPHTCSECDKTYKTKSQLQQHLVTHTMAHTGKSPFMCGKCGRPMASKSRLHIHSIRCQGRKGFKYVLWHQGSDNTGEESKVQAVNLITGQPVNLGEPLFNLLPGQQINIVQHGFGKDATITLLPVHHDSTQGGTLALEHNSLDKSNAISQETLNCAEYMITEGTNPQETISLHSSNDPNDSMVSLPNVTSTMTSAKTSQQTVENGQTVSLLPGQPMAGKLPNSYSEINEGSITTGQLQGSLDSQHTILDHDCHSQATSNTTASSNQILLSEDFSQFDKHEVIIIESADGQQSVLNLANSHVVHTDGTVIFHTESENSGGEHVQNLDISHTRNEYVDRTHGQMLKLIADTKGNEHSEVCGPGPAGEGDLMESEVSIYLCSMCQQQFDSMDLATQHVLTDHSVDTAVSTSVDTDGHDASTRP